MPTVLYELPYEGAKEMLLVDEVDNEEFDELLNGCANQNNIFYGVQGMKLAMGVLDGTYQLTV